MEERSILNHKKKLATLAADVFTEHLRKRFASLQSQPALSEAFLSKTVKYKMGSVTKMSDEAPESWSTDTLIEASSRVSQLRGEHDLGETVQLFVKALSLMLDYVRARDVETPKGQVLRAKIINLEKIYMAITQAMAAVDGVALDTFKELVKDAGVKQLFDFIDLPYADWSAKRLVPHAVALQKFEACVQRIMSSGHASHKAALDHFSRFGLLYLETLKEVEMYSGN